MFRRTFHVFVLVAFLVGLLTVTPASPAAASTEQRGASPDGFINPDGTLNTKENFSGSFDLAGWNVQMDPQRGPVFNKVEPSRNVNTPLASTGQWANVGGWSGPIVKAVSAIAVIGTDVYVGGQFTDAGSIPEADYVARWDGTNWYALGSNGAGNGSLNNTVNTLAVNGSELYVGGHFTNVNNGGTSLGAADYIAKWNGTNWSALGSNGAGNASLSAQVSTIAISGSDIYAGGFFTDVNNNGSVIAEADYIAKFDGSNWSALGNNGAGNGALNSQCWTIVADGLGSIYAGGAFSNAAGIPEADSIAKWNGSAWSALSGNGASNGSLIGTVYALAFNGTDLFVGGGFSNINNNGTVIAEADAIAKWDGTNWSALGSNGAGNGSITQNVYALAVSGTDLYVGGGFGNVNNNGTVLGAGDSLVKWDGTNWSALGSNGSGSGVFTNNVAALAVVGGSVYAGGSFTDPVNSGSTLPLADFIARFDGTNWSALGSATNGSIPAPVSALATGSSSVYAGGNYFDASNSGVNVAAIDNIGDWNGTNWSAVGSGAINSSVNTVFVNGTDVYVGGNFTNAAGLPEADYIAKWNGASWSALGSNGAGNGSLNSSPSGILVDGSNVYLAGSFTNVNNGGTPLAAADYVAKWDGTNWSALGSNGSGDGSLNNSAWALAMIGSDLYVGGFFTNVNNGGTVLTAADYVAKWDGTNWSALGSNGIGNGSINGTVYALKANGTDLYVGGGFSDVNDGGSALNTADDIAKWNTLTSTWSALGDNGAGNGAINNNLFAIAIHGTDVYVGGDFTNAGGVAEADYVAKWNGTTWSALGSNGAGNGSLNGRVSALTIWNSDLYVGGQFTNVNNNGSTLHQADFIAAFGINTPPTNISLSSAAVAENQSAGTTVGALTTTDVNPDSFTYSIACAVPGADDASFQISGSNLQTAASFDYETKNSYSVCVRTDDGNGGIFDKTLAVTVTDVAEIVTVTYKSDGANDGWILESTETSGVGGTMNSSTTTFNLGDNNLRKQYRAILSFDTSSLPDNAIITKVTLKIKKQGLSGTDPFTILGGLTVDMRKPSFGALALGLTDFQSAAGRTAVSTFGTTPVLNWYSAVLNVTGKNYVNKAGVTQFRLRFATDDNNNAVADFMRFFSGNAASGVRPQLIVEYKLP